MLFEPELRELDSLETPEKLDLLEVLFERLDSLFMPVTLLVSLEILDEENVLAGVSVLLALLHLLGVVLISRIEDAELGLLLCNVECASVLVLVEIVNVLEGSVEIELESLR